MERVYENPLIATTNFEVNSELVSSVIPCFLLEEIHPFTSFYIIAFDD